MSTDETQEAVRGNVVRVRIQAMQTIYLDKEVTCRKEDYDRLMAVYESGNERAISDEIEDIFNERAVAHYGIYKNVNIDALAARHDD